jgi:hypothetical protein
LITATPPDNLAILFESFLERAALSVSARSFLSEEFLPEFQLW